MAVLWKQSRWIWALGFFFLPVVATALTDENSLSKPVKLTVTILAVSIQTRHGYAGDEDVYLASLTDQRGAHQLIRLADWKPSGGTSVPAMGVGWRFRLIADRAAWCDSNSRDFFLPASAGERSQYFPSDAAQDQQSRIPCYRDHHESIHAADKAQPAAKQ